MLYICILMLQVIVFVTGSICKLVFNKFFIKLIRFCKSEENIIKTNKFRTFGKSMQDPTVYESLFGENFAVNFLILLCFHRQ